MSRVDGGKVVNDLLVDQRILWGAVVVITIAIGYTTIRVQRLEKRVERLENGITTPRIIETGK